MKKTIIAFSDNDGTLTRRRKKHSPEMTKSILDFVNAGNIFVFSTGADYPDMEKQADIEVRKHKNVYFACCMGNSILYQGKEVFNTGNKIDCKYFKEDLECIVKECPHQFETSYPNHYQLQKDSIINFTMLGRPDDGEPSDEVRGKYAEWDNEVCQRGFVIEYLSSKHPDYNFTLGGEISVDITKKYCDKAQIPYLIDVIVDKNGAISLEFSKKDTKVNPFPNNVVISYFGDRIGKYGNDNTIAHEIVDLGGTIYSVESLEETMEYLKLYIKK